jgi:hypothetical protein
MKPCPSDVAVRQALSFASSPSNSEHDHLLVAHALRRLKAENPDIAEVGGENLTTLGQPLAWDDEEQNTARLQPTIRVAQEGLLCAPTVSRSKCPIVRWIQIQEPKAFDGALHFQRISLDDVGNPLAGLLGAVGVKLDSVAKHIGAGGDRLEGDTIANTRVDRGRGLIWEQNESANPLGLGQGQRVEAESTFALKAQGWAPFSEECARRDLIHKMAVMEA